MNTTETKNYIKRLNAEAEKLTALADQIQSQSDEMQSLSKQFYANGDVQRAQNCNKK